MPRALVETWGLKRWVFMMVTLIVIYAEIMW